MPWHASGKRWHKTCRVAKVMRVYQSGLAQFCEGVER
jgi:hypothetical protein